MTARLAVAAAAALLVAGAAAAKDTPAPHLYGPEPSWAEYRRLAEAAIAERLVDPHSAEFTWLSGIAKAEIRPQLFEPRVAGYWACGRVNAKNRYGVYTGGGTFLVAVDYGRALASSLDTDPLGRAGTVDQTCKGLIARGVLPPIAADADSSVKPAPSTSATPAAIGITTVSGIALMAMPDGAYVRGVTPASPAANAGLKPGMVIASVNAVPLAGMGDAMLKVIDAAGGHATLAVIGGTTIKLGGTK